jgi:hypothetical protein
MKRASKHETITRRRFVGMLAAGSAALVAGGAVAAVPAKRKRPAAAAAEPALSPADRKELERQRAATLTTLEVIRKHRMPPGTELASVFRPLKSRRAGR